MQHFASEELYVVVYHFPFQVVSAGCPVVVVVCLVAFYGDKVFAWVGGEFAVEVGSRNDCFFVFGKSACRFLNDSKHFEHDFVKCFLIHVKCFFL